MSHPAPLPADGAPRPWEVTWITASAAALHARDLPAHVARTVWVCQPTAPALVLGSTQRALLGQLGPGPVVRRSGGGAVWVDPRRSLWIDVLLPRDDPWWVEDVSRAARWLGWTWVGALARLGIDGVVHEGVAARDDLSRLLCFAGCAPGEVTVGGRKAVGVSQRRTRAGARLQCALYVGDVCAGELAAALAPACAPLGGTGPVSEELERRAVAFDVPRRELAAAFLAALGAG